MQESFSTEEIKNQFEQLATHLPMAIAILDKDMRYIFANPRWIADFHLSKNIVGKLHYDVFPEIHADWKDIHQHCLKGNIHKDDEVPFERIDGSLEWLRREIRPWYRSENEIGGLIIYTEIITGSKKAQEELEAQHRFLRQVIDLNTSFIFAKDIDGRFTLVNKALADAYGSTMENMVGKIDEDFNPKTDETAHFRHDDLEVVQTRQSKFIPEESVSNVDTGEVRWYQTIKVPLISDDGKSVQLLGIATDITERKRAQDELQAQHRFLRQIIDLNTSFIFAKGVEGRFILVNKAVADTAGTTPDNMIGKYDHDFNTNKEETDTIHKDDLKVLSTRQSKFIPEEPVTNTVTGEVRWYQTTKIPFISADGETVQLLGVATDITERKQAEEKLEQLVLQEKEARQEVEAASKMKDLFMANMSHELRTPLNAIIGFIREMIYSNRLDSDNTHMANRCLANSKRLNILINSVLDLSRLAVGSLELVILPVNIRKLARDTREDLMIQVKEKNLDFLLEIDETLPKMIKHDEERLIQIMLNLLVNSIKYTETGHIKLLLRQHNDKRLIIEVSDTGVGIPEDMQNHIFDNFVQIGNDSQNQGAGLGLAIVKNLAELMEGKVSIKSKLGAYTIFTVDIPMSLSISQSGETRYD